jgi:hypothetical protein
MIPKTGDPDLYTTILRAGRLRKLAARQHQEADALDAIARIQFEDEGGSSVALAQIPGTVLCLAHGGPAAGAVVRVPFAVVREGRLRLTSEGTVSPVSDGLLNVPTLMTFEYKPMVVVQLGQYVVGSLVVRDGAIESTYEELRQSAASDTPQPIALTVARLLILSVGFNTELVADILNSIERTAAGTDVAPAEPMLVHLGGAA